MNSFGDGTAWRRRRVSVLLGLALTAMLFVPIAGAQTQADEQKTAEQKPSADIFEVFYLANATQQNNLNDIQTDLRNMLPKAKIYGVQSQNAISIRGSAEDLAEAQKLISELDQPRKIYRITYAITEMDGGKREGDHHFTLIVASGGKTTLKQGSRIPIVTGSFDTGSSNSNTQFQYQDVGLDLEASVEGENLHSKVEQTSTAEEKSGVRVQDPIVRQTVLDGMSNLTPGKPVALGSLDVPRGTQHLEIEVASELVK
ncbi:MAG: secretin N-terminal domain-containing protein [Terracidiphilus sp.]